MFFSSFLIVHIFKIVFPERYLFLGVKRPNKPKQNKPQNPKQWTTGMAEMKTQNSQLSQQPGDV